MAQEVLFYISLIIGISALLSILARFIKQPPIIAYLLAGIFVGPLFLKFTGTQETLQMMQLSAHIGIAFLLFIVGLHLDFRIFKDVGKISIITGLAEMLIIGSLGYVLAVYIGFSIVSALYIGIALAFSSTVVVVKILSDKKQLETLHGKIALGILIMQDIAAAICLMIIPIVSQNLDFKIFATKIGIGLIAICLIFLCSVFILRRLLDFLAKSQETIFLFGIAWVLILATLFDAIGFSIEIGALIAGISLASSKYSLDISGKMKPLRDFFIVLFFVFFGSQLTGITGFILFSAVIFSIFVIVIKPLVVMISLKLFGYSRKTNFLASISLAQVSEFSLIIILLGFSLGHLDKDIMNLAVLISIVTIGFSTYTLHYSNSLLKIVMKHLNSSNRSKQSEEESIENKKTYDIILFGYHRMGCKLLQTIKKMGKKFLVIDYNPKVVMNLNKEKIDCIYGDAGNKPLLEEINLGGAELIISTIPDESANAAIAEIIKETKSKAIFIATAEQPREALDLYKIGADYVIIPHHLGGSYAAEMIKKFKTDKKQYKRNGEKHKKKLNEAKNNSFFK